MRGNGFQGTATGKLGDTVFYRCNGEQRARIYVKPRTSYSLPNLKVRCRFASSSNAWQVFKQAEFVAIQRKEKQTSYDIFQHLNFSVAPYLTREECMYRKLKRQCKIAPYIVSWGTLSNIWEPITSVSPYAMVNGQQRTGMTLRFLIDHEALRKALAGREEEGTIETSLGYLVTALARIYGAGSTHLGLFAAYGPAADAYGYCYDRFAYAELWNGCEQDLRCTAQWMQSEHKWQLNFGGSVTIMGWQVSATYDNPGFTITYAPTSQQGETHIPCAAALIAVSRERGGTETSRSQLVMQEWMENPYNASLEESYATFASGTFSKDEGEYMGDDQLICGPDGR